MSDSISRHRVRRTCATILGGFGVAILGLGIISIVLMSFVSSPNAAKSTVMSALAQPDVRNVIADELIEKLQDSADNDLEKLVFSIARPVIVAAVREKLADPVLREFAGDIAATVYGVYVDKAPATTIDISELSDATIAAIRAVDPSIPTDQYPKMDPLKVERKPGDPDISAIRDLAQTGSLLFILVGLLLQVAAWFLATAGNWKKLQRLGIRLTIGAGIFFIALTIAKSQIPQSVNDNKAAAKATAEFVINPMLTRFLIMAIVGVIAGIIGFFLHRKETQTVS